MSAKPDQYEELGQFKTINGVCWNTICLAGPYLLVRSELEAACVELSFLDTPSGDVDESDNNGDESPSTDAGTGSTDDTN